MIVHLVVMDGTMICCWTSGVDACEHSKHFLGSVVQSMRINSGKELCKTACQSVFEKEVAIKERIDTKVPIETICTSATCSPAIEPAHTANLTMCANNPNVMDNVMDGHSKA